MNTIVLNSRQIEQKIQRIAYEILENNFESEIIFLFGIKGNGFILARELSEILLKISDQKIITGEITVNKHEPLSEPITSDVDLSQTRNHTVILVDDVINSGKTMQYALIKLLEQPLKRIKTVALVDRKHRRYPIRCDYVGLTLSTTLQERVEVSLEDKKEAYLV
ncbi:MAG: phosphoribosyltransferase family protein [Brumimicrobium sp.]|nr:phosphoribosyltransferase family protein [Brumimicrobium sp.]